MRNSPATAAETRRLKKGWFEKLKDTNFPRHKRRKCKGCGEIKDCEWLHSFTRTGKPEYRARCKGAIRARSGEVGIIPGSQGTNSYIVLGKGEDESFHSASHGAGRRMGRRQAKRELDLAIELAKMEGIVHGLDRIHVLDEAPGSYKDIDKVMDDQMDLVSVVDVLAPLANIKG